MYTYCLYCIHVCVWISIPLLSQTASGFEYIKSLLRWLKSRWWFQIFFIFTPTWGRFSIWLIFFKWVETANQKWIFRCLAEAWFAGKKKASLREARHREGREWGYARLLFFPVLLLLSHLDRRTGSHLPSREIRKKCRRDPMRGSNQESMPGFFVSPISALFMRIDQHLMTPEIWGWKHSWLDCFYMKKLCLWYETCILCLHEPEYMLLLVFF